MQAGIPTWIIHTDKHAHRLNLVSMVLHTQNHHCCFTAVFVVTCTPMHSFSTKLGCILFALGVSAVTVTTEVYKAISFRGMKFSCSHHIVYLACQF